MVSMCKLESLRFVSILVLTMINCAQCQHRLEQGGSVKNRVTNENDFSYDKREILPGACKERNGTPGGFTNCDYCQATVDESG